MNRNNFWRLILVVLVVLWSLYELYPPKGRDLVQYFRDKAVNRDPAFTAIFTNALALQKAMPEKPYDNLVTAIGTNDITRYFPSFGAKDQLQPTAYILNRLQRKAAGRIRLGLDLQGGTSFLVSMDTNQLANAADASTAISHAVEVLRKRVDKFGVAEPLIQPQGHNRILVQLPGLSAADQESAKAAIQRAAFLEFRLVCPTSDQDIKDGIVQPGYEIKKRKERTRDGRERIEEVEVKRRAEMDGSGLKSAMVVRGTMGEPEIHFTLDSKGAERFAEITRENVGQRLAIILDGELYSAPVIQTPIETGSGQITGQFDNREAFELANVLENPLRAPLRIDESREVDPTLGKDSIRSGISAAIYGTLAVAVFMIIYYLLAGIVANIAIVANIIILLGVMCSIGTTLTLPGIAGIVLTVGMAVDANVLIYERIREESAKGKSLRGAIDAGYARAFGTIFDSNLTTLISSVILIYMGTGSIKGFGVTLTIGICASMFTALIVTRLIFDFLLARGWLKALPMLHLVRAEKIDFMKLAKPAFITSWIVIAIGIVYTIRRGEASFGVEFRGGDTVLFAFEQKPGEADVRTALTKVGVKDPRIQFQKDVASRRETLRVDSAPGTAEKVKAALAEMTSAKFHLLGQDRIGATIGKEIQKSAAIALLLSLFGILIYVAFRYEFSFAVGSVVALIHDALITLGIYCISGREFNSATVAAILTIIGFSINDTIVIFDRIREDLKLGIRGSFREVVNKALNQTLSRTIITSGTVFLSTLSLYIFGGGAINDFAFTFLIGILVGTYSSIYIASAIVLWWHKGQRPHIGAGAQPTVVEGVPAPARK
ncbi:MAG TPA: protein translocase subunit SecD [Candidatus Paceibacterota bacterium]|nr:protein translocase subunit SecD [Verrucomicrobiota bacterium]HSA12701.1 protein translocase subunit SecD [Candidatus Paceibacterota bacterium]